MTLNIREAVVSQMEQKIEAGEILAAAIGAEGQARAALEEASAGVARARQSALRAGWSESELKKLGLVPNARGARGRQVRAGSREGAESDRVDG